MFNNKSIFTLRVHGYGGQGIKTIAGILAEAAIAEGMYAQAFPEFGPERRGAPVKAYGRFSVEPIFARTQIEKPDFVIVLDEHTLSLDATREGTDEKTYFLIQTDLIPKEVKEKYPFLPDYHKIHCIDAISRIAEYDNKVHLSIPVIGKFIRITELIPLETVVAVFNKKFLDKIGEEKVRLAEKSLEEAYYQV